MIDSIINEVFRFHVHLLSKLKVNKSGEQRLENPVREIRIAPAHPESRAGAAENRTSRPDDWQTRVFHEAAKGPRLQTWTATPDRNGKKWRDSFGHRRLLIHLMIKTIVRCKQEMKIFAKKYLERPQAKAKTLARSPKKCLWSIFILYFVLGTRIIVVFCF